MVERFSVGLAGIAAKDGQSLNPVHGGPSNRDFVVQTADIEVRLVVRLSQVVPGFWGLQFDKAAKLMREPHNFLVLLIGPSRGYLIPGQSRVETVSKRSSAFTPSWRDVYEN